ncbi:hypothetical protein QTP88_029377 [Uroleucon formosanum]
MPESDILDITSQYETDSKITKIEYHSYTPYSTSFNNNDEIRISIQQTDVYPYLQESFIFLEGMFSEADNVKLFNNGYFYLFEQIRLEINGIEVDSTRVLGITSSLKGYLFESYYENSIRNPILSPSTFLSNALIIVINTSKQNDSAKASAVDVQLKIEALESLTGVTAYCFLIHDRIVGYVPFTREEIINIKQNLKKEKKQYSSAKIKNLKNDLKERFRNSVMNEKHVAEEQEKHFGPIINALTNLTQ